MKYDNQPLETSEFQSHSSQPVFTVRPGNQNFRLQGPQNFIHHQPPPMTQNSQFNSQRGQIMSSSNVNMYQNVGQVQVTQPPKAATHQYMQDMNSYQQNNNSQLNQQGNLNRFNIFQQQQQAPMGGDTSNGMMAGNYQQQSRFRQW